MSAGALAAVVLGAGAHSALRPPGHTAGRSQGLYALQPPASLGAVYNGRAGQISVHIPRIDANPAADGSLNAPVWQQAATLTGFSEYLPVDGVAAEDSTDVLVWYSPTAIYFGVRAYEPHGSVHATLANRDKIDGDDNIQLIITPFLHARQSLVFAVNPLGVQEDGTLTEGTTSARGYGVTNQTGPPPTDLSPDFVFESKGQLTPFGYQVVIKIPFRSIKYQSSDPQDWGLNVVRVVQHSGHHDTWHPTRLAAASFLQQSGTLVGLTGLERGLALDLNPFTTERAVGSAAAPGTAGWHYGVARPQVGANVRWGVTNNLLLNGTYRPDFAEVEADATQLVLDPRHAVQYPEKRPFFLDGLEQFNTPNNLIYTRQIEAPIGAAKLTGKVSNLSIAYLGAQDDQGSPAAGGGGKPLFNVLRLRDDFAQGSQVGVALTDWENGGSFNRLASADTRITWAKIYSLALQAAGSDTRAPGRTGAGPLWQTRFTRGGRSFILDYDLIAIDPQFVAASGFISRTGVVEGALDHRLTVYPEGTPFETVGLDASYNDTWVYRRFTSAQAPEDRSYKFTGLATLHGGWQLLAGIYLEAFGYDPSLYAKYYVGHIVGHDTTYTHFVGTPTIANTDYLFQISTPQFSKFDLTLFEAGGRDENFYEWSAADVTITEATLNFRPTDKWRAQLSYNAQIYQRHDDGTTAARTLIPRLALEYQLSRPIFFRVIGQYDATYQNNLRDDSRTGLPIFFRDPATGLFTRAAAFSTNQFQLSGLFSYQPLPGTVAFVGYGNNLTEPSAFHFLTLRRTADQFFVKFSYLFRAH